MNYKNNNANLKGRKAYNDGQKVIYLTPEDEIPEGFKLGGLSKRTHEQSVLIGQKSGETQRRNWQSKTEQEKQAWSVRMSESHSNSNYAQLRAKLNTEYRSTLSKEENDRQNQLRSESLKQYWSHLDEATKLDRIKKSKDGGAGWNQSTIEQTNLSKYGVVNQFQRNDVQWNYSHSDSQPNLEFAKLLDLNGIEYTKEFALERYSYDFKIGNILIEVDPTATHSSSWSPFGEHIGIDKNYHFNKSVCAKNHGYRCIHVFDWDDKDKIISILKQRTTVYARNTAVEEIPKSIARDYLNKYHLQGYANDVVRLGMFYNDELISVMTFGKPRYNKKAEYELIRYCSHYHVVGGAEKLFHYFVYKYNPKSIVSYCDTSKFNGDVYLKLGFVYETNTLGRHWYHVNEKIHITDNLLRQRGFDQLFGNKFGVYGKGTDNIELMKTHGFIDLYDAGQSRYMWTGDR